MDILTQTLQPKRKTRWINHGGYENPYGPPLYVRWTGKQVKLCCYVFFVRPVSNCAK
jgi:hypothetical protein